MPGRTLLLSSYVARGTVGLKATEPPLRHAGIEVIGLPSTLLSNHPAHSHVAGTAIDPAVLLAMIDALDKNGWLQDLDIFLSGYLPTPDHVGVAAHLLDRLATTAPHCRYVCDPVIGDDPMGLYVSKGVADAIRNKLVPRAHLLTPNRFELSYLADTDIHSPGQAASAARNLSSAMTVVTSVPGDTREDLANVLVTENSVTVAAVSRRQRVPHGTGDVMTGLLIPPFLAKTSADKMLQTASRTLSRIVDRSLGRDALDLSVFFGNPA